MSKLTPFEQKCYEWFRQGLTAGGIAIKYKVKYADVVEARYQILKKGYSLNNIEDTRKEMETMARGAILTEEEKREIIQYRETHTAAETAEKFGRGTATINRIMSEHKHSEPDPLVKVEQAPVLTSVEVSDAVPESVLRAVRKELKEYAKLVADTEALLASFKAAHNELAGWLEVHDDNR